MAVLAIDQGTSGTKAVVVADDGEVLGIAEVSVRPSYLAGGGVEQDPRATAVVGPRRRAARHRRRGGARDRGLAGQSGRNRPGLGPGDRASR